MRILIVGDVVGRPGRHAFKNFTQKIRQDRKLDVVIVNGENAAHGKGLTKNTFNELLSSGADIVTSGNHIWDKSDVLAIIDQEPFLIRPANYPDAPGRGFCVYPFQSKDICVVNIAGRAFMQPIDCPFRTVETIIREVKDSSDIIIVDFHAETTSEKMAMGFFLDGLHKELGANINLMFGTHTHVQTADDRILTNGTGYITDIGMVGVRDSVIGVAVQSSLDRFLTGRLTRFEVAEGSCIYCAMILEIDDSTNKTLSLERIFLNED